MAADSLLMAILVVLSLTLMVAGFATALILNTLRKMRTEQQATRRAIGSADATGVLSNLQVSAKEAVRILDVIDKRLQKLEALEKLQISNNQSQFKQQRQR